MENNRPDISIFLRGLANGGAEKIMVNLANYFVQHQFKVDLVLTQTEGAYNHLVSSSVRIVDLKSPKLPNSLPKLVKYLREKQPLSLLTALHYPCEIALWAKKLAKVSTRVVVSEHNTLSLEAKYLSRLSVRFSPIMARLFYPWADGIIAVSQGVAEDLSQVTKIPLAKIDVIYNPVITTDIYKKSQVKVDHTWFQSTEIPVIIAVGRLVKQKDYPSLIKAFAQVQEQISARLVILGDGEEQNNLIDLAKQLEIAEKINFLGFVDNPYCYISQANVLVLSSQWEGFGNVLVEALALQTPVVSTNCKSGPSEILAHGKYGELVTVGDIEAMKTAILKVLSRRNKVVDSEWLNQFTIDYVAKKYLSVLGFDI